MKKVLFCIDFDGVIMNSIDECCITSYNAYFDRQYNSISAIPKQFIEYFYENRYMVGPAKYFYIICKTFEDSIQLTRKIFNEKLIIYDKEFSQYANKFYFERTQFKDHMQKWFSSHSIYNQFETFLNTTNNNFIIVTNKDKNSVEQLSKYFGFSNRILEIYSKEISEDKKILFTQLMIKYAGYNKYYFVDDNPENIKSVEKINKLDCFIAGWGYNRMSELNNFNIINSFNSLIIN